MAIGPRIGPVLGPRIGPAIGTDEIKSGSAVITDATSGKGVPLTQAQWNTVFSNSGMANKTVAHSWDFQDASGNITRTIGDDLVAAGTLDYQQNLTGWTRKGVTFTNNTADAAAHAAAVGADPSANSVLWFAYIDIATAAVVARQVLTAGGAAAASEAAIRHDASRFLQIKILGATAQGAADLDLAALRPFVLLHDRSGSRAIAYTEAEKVVGTYNAGVTDGVKGFGAASATSAGMTVSLAAVFSGSDAEWTDAQVKAVLQALGWTVAWSP